MCEVCTQHYQVPQNIIKNLRFKIGTPTVAVLYTQRSSLSSIFFSSFLVILRNSSTFGPETPQYRNLLTKTLARKLMHDEKRLSYKDDDSSKQVMWKAWLNPWHVHIAACACLQSLIIVAPSPTHGPQYGRCSKEENTKNQEIQEKKYIYGFFWIVQNFQLL